MSKFFLAAFIGLIAVALGGAELKIVENGKSDYVITFPDTAFPVVRTAALDLQKYIARATAAQLPIVRASEVGGRPAFRLGFLKAGTVPESFTIQVRGRDIHISGVDSAGDPLQIHWAQSTWAGTWFGVCDFLEKQLDIHWFFPGEAGEYVAPRTSWSVDANLNFSEAPAMDMRNMQYTIDYSRRIPVKELRERRYWLRRNRSGMANSWCGWHSWLHHLRGKDYFDQHPEWFALINGRRYGNDTGLGLKICTTNSEALDQLAKNLIAYRKKWRADIMLTLSPNDGGVFCECPKCQALDNGVRADGSRIITDRILTYANEVARRVKKELPNQKFGLYAYGLYKECAGKVKVDDAITIMTVLNDTGSIYYRPEVRAEHLRDMLAWKKRVKKIYFYDFPEGMGNLNLPCPQYRNLVMLYDNLYQAGVAGYMMNNPSSFSSSGLNHYFYLKFAWHQVENPDRLYRETLEKCYGPNAAPVVLAYFEDLERRYSVFANSKLAKEDRAMGYYATVNLLLQKVMPGLPEAWLGKLNQALGRTRDAKQRIRLKMLIDNLEYTAVTLKLYDVATKLRSSQQPDVTQAVLADKLAAQREKQLKAMQNLPDNVNFKSILTSARHYNLPFDRNIFSFMISSQKRRQAAAVRLKALPRIDGQLTDPCWQAISPLRVEQNKDNAQVFRCGALARVAVDQQKLYLGISCEEPLVHQLKDSGVTPQSPVWNENYLDIFIDPSGNGSKYYQLCINSLGTCRMFKISGGKSVEVDLKPQIATSRGSACWNLELAVPLASLTRKTDCRGDVWGFNIGRARRTVQPHEYSCWSPTFGGFHNPERFGVLTIR